MTHSSRGTAVAAATVLVSVLAGGRAFAYFTAQGAGAGAGPTASLQPPVIQPATTGTPSSLLTPGSTADLLIQVSNPNPGPLTITSVSQGGGVGVTGGSGCTSDPAWPTTRGNSGVSIPTLSGQAIAVPGGATVVLHVPNGASMSTTSASACQGATFQMPVTVTVRQ